MKISEAIALVDELKPNQYSTAVKVKWLSTLDGIIFKEVYLTHHGPLPDFEPYDGTDTTLELLVPYPYDMDIYNSWLQSQIDRENGEIVRYNQTSALFNAAYDKFKYWFNRTHIPKLGFFRFRF